MKKVLTKILPFLGADKTPRKHKPIGQSLLEFAIALPVLVFILMAMMEFGFILNFYLSLLDATREAAHWASLADPFRVDPVSGQITYYSTTAGLVKGALDPKSLNPTYEGRRLILNESTDDVIVTVYCVTGSGVTAYPSAGGYHLYGNDTSAFTATDISNTYLSGAPEAGLVLVEVYFGYKPVIGMFYRNTIMLRAHSIMPANAADPIGDPAVCQTPP